MIKPFVIVAGGPSLKGFDFSLLDDCENVIAVNKAYTVLPCAKWIYFSDLRFWEAHKIYLLKHSAEVITGHKRVNHSQLTKYKFTSPKGLDLTPGCLRTGNNSGYAAINLAYHLGARVIYLLGFDMCQTKKDSHWHDGHGLPLKDRTLELKMLPYFDTIEAPLFDAGVEVYNVTGDPISKITCFTTLNQSDFIYILPSIRPSPYITRGDL